MLLKLVPDNTGVQFTNLRIMAAGLSIVLVIGSIVALLTLGLNFGVDFKGGVTIEVADEEPIAEETLRSAISDLGVGDVKVQSIQDFAGGAEGVVVFIQQQKTEGDVNENETAQQDALDTVKAKITEILGDNASFRKTDVVGPTVSGELINKGIIAVVLAIVGMLAYIWLRFEWQFSVGAILALVHDVIITLGMFSVTQLVFNLPIIAAILTIVGYSMNDTVVVYDRVRENLRKFKKKPLRELLDLSINDTLSRTVMTSVTTLIALIALYIVGGEVLRGFTFAMIWGVLIGTYSSIFVAAPILLTIGVKRDWSKVNSGEPQPA